MKELFEFRLSGDDVDRTLGPDVGVRLGSARKIVVSPGDSLFDRIGEVERSFRAVGNVFIMSWQAKRSYTAAELSAAKLLKVRPAHFLDCAGEESGTQYEENTACPDCGAGARQLTPLILKSGLLGKHMDFAVTIASEVVVSAKVVSAFTDSGLTGAAFGPVYLAGRSGIRESQSHFQLLDAGPTVTIATSTATGGNPFDELADGKCPRGDRIGRSVLSELFIRSSSWDESDVVRTTQFVGVRRGMLRPWRLRLVSQRAFRVLQDTGLSESLVVEVSRFQ